MTALNVPCAATVWVTARFTATHLCPYRNETDQGSTDVTWLTTAGETVELHALAELVHGRAGEKVSHEQWTADLADSITARVKLGALTVTSTWSTAGAVVTCRAGAPNQAVDR